MALLAPLKLKRKARLTNANRQNIFSGFFLQQICFIPPAAWSKDCSNETVALMHIESALYPHNRPRCGIPIARVTVPSSSLFPRYSLGTCRRPRTALKSHLSSFSPAESCCFIDHLFIILIANERAKLVTFYVAWLQKFPKSNIFSTKK